MSGRTGRVQRGIRRAFIAARGRDLTTRELMAYAYALPLYRGRSSRRNRVNYCRSIHRAASRMCVRVGRVCGWVARYGARKGR
jgi:hypothetical protein